MASVDEILGISFAAAAARGDTAAQPRHMRTATVDANAGEYDEFAVESSLESSCSSDSQPGPPESPQQPYSQRAQDPEYEVPQGKLTETQVMQLYNIRNLDRYGFVADAQQPSPTAAELDKRAKRVRKWHRMLGPQGAGWKLYFERKPDKVKRRIRKGIPIEFRGLAWQLLSGGKDLMTNNPGLYRSLIDSANGDYEQMIMRDLNRTFPNHIKFIGRQGPGQRDLYHVLLAYAAYDKKVGYVQGMGFITAVLLIFMPEEEAFWTLVALMKGTTLSPLEELFVPEMPLLKQYLYQLELLIKQDCPRLYNHFEQEGVHLSMFCTHWFNTVFAYMLPFEHLLRVWDIFLLEGIKSVFRVGLGLLKSSEKDFVQMKFETLVAALQSKKYPILSRPPEELLKIALRISVSKRLEVLKEQYWKLEEATAGS